MRRRGRIEDSWDCARNGDKKLKRENSVLSYRKIKEKRKRENF